MEPAPLGRDRATQGSASSTRRRQAMPVQCVVPGRGGRPRPASSRRPDPGGGQPVDKAPRPVDGRGRYAGCDRGQPGRSARSSRRAATGTRIHPPRIVSRHRAAVPAIHRRDGVINPRPPHDRAS